MSTAGDEFTVEDLMAPLSAGEDHRLAAHWRSRIEQHHRDVYAGVPMSKFPEDLRTYELILWESNAQIVIEVGVAHGGSTLWLRDRLFDFQRYRCGPAPVVLGLDVNLAAARSSFAGLPPEATAGIELLEGDVKDDAVVSAIREKVPRDAQVLVIEDAAHDAETTLAALRGLAPLIPEGGSTWSRILALTSMPFASTTRGRVARGSRSSNGFPVILWPPVPAPSRSAALRPYVPSRRTPAATARPMSEPTSPSRFGAPGLLVRRIVRRALQPVTVPLENEHARLADEVARTGSQAKDLGVAAESLGQRVSALEQALEAEVAYVQSTDAVLDGALRKDLRPGARVLRTPAGPCRRAICSLATGSYRSLLGRSALSFERYAERWGWDLILSTESLAAGRPAPWSKVPLLRSLLGHYDWVLWLDADVVVTDLDADISSEIREGKDLYLVEHPWLGQYTANSGVMLLRSNEWSRSFLDAVWAKAEFTDHPWWENAAVLELLGYGLAPARLVRPTPWLSRTQIMDRRWNSIELAPVERPAFVHRGFYDVWTRTRQVTADLQCALTGADPMTAGRERPAHRVTAPADVHRRQELPLLLNALDLTGAGVHVGVGKGEFSEWLLDIWRGEKLFSIDPWRTEVASCLDISQDEHDCRHAEAGRRLARFGSRSQLWQSSGAEAAPSFPAECLDLVYLAALRDDASTLAELGRWWPLVRPGGVIAAAAIPAARIHPECAARSQDAAHAFLGRISVEIHLMRDDPEGPGWMARKPTRRSKC